MKTGQEANFATFFSLTRPTFLLILIIRIFSSGESVDLETIMLSCRKMSGLVVGGVMFYVGISIDKFSNLHIVRNVALTGRRCRDEILRAIVVP